MSGGSGRMRAGLIVFETAAAVVLVIGAGLLIRSFAALSQVNLGFRTERLLVADTAVPVANRRCRREGVQFYRALLPQLAAIPGVQSAAAVMGVPTVQRSNGGYAIEGGMSSSRWASDRHRRPSDQHAGIFRDAGRPGSERTRLRRDRPRACAPGRRGERGARARVVPGRGPDRTPHPIRVRRHRFHDDCRRGRGRAVDRPGAAAAASALHAVPAASARLDGADARDAHRGRSLRLSARGRRESAGAERRRSGPCLDDGRDARAGGIDAVVRDRPAGDLRRRRAGARDGRRLRRRLFHRVSADERARFAHGARRPAARDRQAHSC